ncbi:MAG: aminoacyl-tRNA hydrolase [Gemmatimonadota bacterium]|nr:aminoacyl-tRNA hydrolase [Gemmatimonadota bacterium]
MLGLGNPGPEYDATRHNVGWWALDRMAHDWDLGPFEREGKSLIAEGRVGRHPVRLVKPLTWMNRSGQVVGAALEHRDPATHLMVLVDDAYLDAGRLRLRGKGSAGGHNGLESVEQALGTSAYARLRIGVGPRPERGDLADWVLAPMSAEDEQKVLDRLEDVVDGVRVWMDRGLEAAMNRVNG